MNVLWEEITMNLLEKLMSIINKQKQAILFSQKDKEIIREISQCNNSYYKTKILDVLQCELSDWSYDISKYVESNGYSVVRDLVGHGIGTHLHEDPQIPNFKQRRKGMKLRPGMTLAIEPMVNEGSYDVVWLDDDWTVVTEDGSLAAHYENTIVITEDGCEILTLSE